jgi:hypothetical protein
VVGAVGRQHLVPSGVQPRHAYGVLDRLGPAGGEEHVAQAGGCDVHDQTGRRSPDVGGEGRGERAEPVRLLLDGRHDPRVLVAEVGEDQLRAEVEVGAALVVDQVAADATHERRHRAWALHCPGVEDQLVEVHALNLGPVPHPHKCRS